MTDSTQQQTCSCLFSAICTLKTGFHLGGGGWGGAGKVPPKLLNFPRYNYNIVASYILPLQGVILDEILESIVLNVSIHLPMQVLEAEVVDLDWEVVLLLSQMWIA